MFVGVCVSGCERPCVDKNNSSCCSRFLSSSILHIPNNTNNTSQADFPTKLRCIFHWAERPPEPQVATPPPVPPPKVKIK